MGSTTCGTPLAVAAVAAALLLIFAASTGSLSLLGSSDVATRSRSRLPRSSAAVSTGSSAPAPPLHFVGTRIPRYIHQLWATVPWWHANGTAAAAAAEELPSAVWSAFLAWQHHNPDAVHVVWTDVTMERLVAQRFPALLAVYRSMKMIQRADLFRSVRSLPTILSRSSLCLIATLPLTLPFPSLLIAQLPRIARVRRRLRGC